MTNVEKIERFIKSEIFTLDDLNDAYPPRYKGFFEGWVSSGLSAHGLRLCEQGGRYYVGIKDSKKSWSEIATSMAFNVGSENLIDTIIAYMDLVLENEKPKTVEISYNLEELSPGDIVVYKTTYGGMASASYSNGIEPEGQARRDFMDYYKGIPLVILKDCLTLLVKQ